MIRTSQLLSALLRRMVRVPFVLLPEGRGKFLLRTVVSRAVRHLPEELLVNPGETAVLIGEDRIENVMLWSDLVGDYGRVVLVDSSSERLESVRGVIENQLRWPLRNIVYLARQPGDSLDRLFADNAIAYVHHVHVVGQRANQATGGELDALATMTKALSKPGVRIHVRTAHVKDGRVFYPQIVEMLRAAGLAVVVGRDTASFDGKEIYATRLPLGRRSRAPGTAAPLAR